MSIRWTKCDYWGLIKDTGPMTVGSIWIISGRPRHSIRRILRSMTDDKNLSRRIERIGDQSVFVYRAIGTEPARYINRNVNPEDEIKGRILSGTCRLSGPVNAAIDRWLGVRQGA